MYLTPNFVKSRMYKLVGIMILLIISVCFANGQSKKIDNPTPLTSNEISGLIDSDTKGNIYYYSFWANPGEVTITAAVAPGESMGDLDFPVSKVQFKLLGQNKEELVDTEVFASPGKSSQQVVASVKINKRQLIVLSIGIPSVYFINRTVGGKYRLRIGGSVSLNEPSNGLTQADIDASIKNTSAGLTQSDLDAEVVSSKLKQLLPKKGILRVKMKDGTIKTIDLSQVDEIGYVEP